MILKTPIWLVHLAANQSSVMSIPNQNHLKKATEHITKIEAKQILQIKNKISDMDRTCKPKKQRTGITERAYN